MKLCTIGLGYIGLPTSIMFANHDVDVVGVDVNQEVIDKLNHGTIHIEEPGLQDALESVLYVEKFRAASKPEKADVFILSVPTPNKQDEYLSCDLTYVKQATDSIIPYLEKGNVVIIESTIAPRTMDDHVKPQLEEAGFIIGEDIYLVHCPERVLPGKIMQELVENNRIVGGVTPQCTEKGAEVYETFVKGEIIKTDARTAEMSKLMENTFRDVNIALANELTKVCNDLSINVLEVIRMANKHPRVNLHTPGPGVGGHCLAVDPYFIIAKSPENSPIIQLARETNNAMPDYVVESTKKLLAKHNGKKVTVFGLTYKGDVDDIRESPAMEIYEKLRTDDALDVVAYDPHVNLSFVEKNLDAALENADLVLVLSDHSQFKYLKGASFEKMRTAQVFDTKNIVEEYNETLTYINYGNLYAFL